MPETKDRARIKELTAALQAKAAEIDTIGDSFKDETGHGHFVITTEQKTAYQAAIGEAEEIKGLIELEERRGGVHGFLGGAAGGQPAAAADATAAQLGALREIKTLSQMWMDSDQYREIKESGYDPERFRGAFHTDRGIRALAEAKDIYSAMAGTINIPALGTPQNVGLVPRQLRPGRVRDLFPADTTTANLLYGIRETGFTNNAAVIPERISSTGGPATGATSDVFAPKPPSNLAIVPVTYPVSTIAHIMYVHRNTLADEPRMQGLIDRDLMDGVKLQEDYQILYGDGVGDNMTGIMNTPGIQVYTGSAADPRTAQIRRAITRVRLAYFEATGIVTHPLDWENLELERDAMGQYRLAVSVAMGAQKTVWRLDIVDTVAIQEGSYLMGAFGLGAKLYDREQVTLAVSTENRDMFERNAVTLRAEERLALTVDRPESFVMGTLTTPTVPQQN
jgi:HK97 family phage major capsid protein